MNKNIGKKFLSFICVGILGIGISLFNLGKNKAGVENSYGKRSELGDVSILLQSNKGMYETDEIKINKDGVTMDTMAKQSMHNFNLSKRNIKSRQVLEAAGNGYIDYTGALLEDEDRLASVLINSEYTENGDYETYANIKIKYNDDDEVESYEIPISDQSIGGSESVYSSVPISIDKDNVYIVILRSYHSQENIKQRESEDHEDDDFDKTELNLYKINLSSKSSKYILNKEFDENDIYVKGNLCFANNNKSYFLINKKENEKSYKSSLLEFDVFSKEINIIDLGTKEELIKNFSIDDNKLLLTSFQGVEDKNKNLEIHEVRVTLVNLENSKVEYLKHINVNINEDNILQVRRVGNKIYFITKEYNEDEENKGKNFYCISVFDEDKNKVTYKGRIKQNSSYFVNVGIVKEDEL